MSPLISLIYFVKVTRKKYTSKTYLEPSETSNMELFNPLYAYPTKWSSTLKQFVGNLPTNCLSVFDHFVKLALKMFLKNSQRL